MYKYDIYKIIKILSDDQIKEINKLLCTCSRESDWVDGNNTFEGDKGTKLNTELNNGFVLKKIRELVTKTTNECRELADFTFPKEISGCIISKTEKGGYYNTHTDCADNGDFSSTLFLSDKDSYEGGELCLWINGKEEKIKLNPGYAIVYPTGIPHRVNKVTSGTRYAFIFWLKSIFKDEVILETCRELRSIDYKGYVRLKPPDPTEQTMEDAFENIDFKIENSINRLMRKFGNFGR
jgi:PKHD-type hydroxylase